MAGHFYRGCVGLWALGVLGGLVFADDRTSSPQENDDKVARLEALLEAQQRKIDALEKQVAAAQQADTDAARVEAMKQQIREVLSEQEFRESLMPSMLQAGYDEGFYIRSSDEKFLLRINGYMQFRWTHYGTRASNRYLLPGFQRDDRTGFDVQRLRLSASGHAYSKDLTYYIEMRADAPDGYDVRLHQAYVNYRLRDELQFRAGLFNIASTRAQATHDLGQQFVDRPLADAVYGLGYGVGVRFWGQAFNKRFEYFLDIVNSFAEDQNAALGRTITTDPAELDGNPALALRLVWHAMGEDPTKDFKSQSDVEFHQSPALDFGFHYAFNDDMRDAQTTRIPFPLQRLFGPGGFGLTTTNGLQINQFGWDAAFKWQGFSATGEYIIRIVDPRRAGRRPFTPWWLLTGDDSTTVQHGAYVQLGYFLPIPGLEKKLEAVARIGGISTLGGEQEGTWEYAGGLNYYIEGNKVKLQTDVTKVSEVPISSSYSSLANVNDDALIWRVQLVFSF